LAPAGRAGSGVTLAAVPYDRANLHRNEEIILDTHPHWIMLVGSVVSVAVSTAIGIFLLQLGWDGFLGTATKWIGVLFIVCSLAYMAHRFVKWYSTNFVLTTDRCIYREGIISKRGIEIPLERINTVFFHQHLFERMVRAGDLTIESAGELGMQRFEDIRDPVAVQNLLYQTMEDNENRKFDRIRQPGPGPVSVADEITKLAALRDQGHLTAAEFEAQKASLLARPPQAPGAPPQ
jgi:membrane protein YdbS with pleckstrin-like domain